MRIISILFFALSITSCQKTPADRCTYFRGAFMGVPYNVVIGKQLSEREKQNVERLIEKTVSLVDRTCNLANSASEISRFNEQPANHPVPVSEPLQNLLSLCSRIVSLSGGRFDPTVEPLERVWREALQQKSTPDPLSTEAACETLGWSLVQLKGGSLAKAKEGVRLDLNAVAKGQWVDWTAEELLHAGYADLFIAWGGAYRAAGHHPERPVGQGWLVQVHPALTMNGRSLAPIPLCDAALCTSGGLRNKGWTLPTSASPDQEPHQFLPIIDPLTAQPLETTDHSIAAAAVIASSCAVADALATAAMIFPTRKEAEKWAQEAVEFYPSASFWILSHE